MQIPGFFSDFLDFQAYFDSINYKLLEVFIWVFQCLIQSGDTCVKLYVIATKVKCLSNLNPQGLSKLFINCVIVWNWKSNEPFYSLSYEHQ